MEMDILDPADIVDYRATFAISLFDPILSGCCYIEHCLLPKARIHCWLDALPFISFVGLFIGDLTRALEALH